MKDIPIIFSDLMARALLDGRKTMTRRLAWRREPKWGDARPIIGSERDYMLPSSWKHVQPGDRLWVKENFWRYGRWIGTKKSGKIAYTFEPLPWAGKDAFSVDVNNLEYAADTDDTHPRQRGKFAQIEPGWHLRPNIFLERRYSRLTLIITAVKIERVQSISTEDAGAEGIYETEFYDNAENKVNAGAPWSPERLAFADLWVTLHGNESWESNPEVVAITFTVHKQNIDKMPKDIAA